jgi:hypothetical protein
MQACSDPHPRPTDDRFQTDEIGINGVQLRPVHPK